MKPLSLVLVFAVTACSAPAQTEVFLGGVFTIPPELVTRNVPLEEMRYLLWLPEQSGVGEPPDLVVYLHGSGDDDYDSRWLTAFGLPAVMLFDDLPADRPFVLLAPQAAPGTAWNSGRQLDTVMALIESVIDAHALDAGRVSLTGVSMGGYGVWHLATRYPERFIRVASVSGSGYGTTMLPDGLDVCVLAAVDLRAYHGNEDMISIPDLNREAIAAWEARCGETVDFRELVGTGHFETAEQVYRDPDFYRWFLTG
jgi:predicted peptidase